MANDKKKGASASKKSIETTGSLLDVRLAILRTDFNPDEHGDSVSFWAQDEPLFQDDKGKLDQDCQVALGLFGFDEPHDGMSISMTSPEGRASILYGDDTDEMGSDIERLLKNSFVSDARFAQAIAKIVSTSWGFGCDYDEVKEEALDQLEDFTCISESDVDILTIEESSPAGGVLIEIVLCSDVPATVAPDGGTEFPEDIEWDDVRGDRFICLLVPKFKSAIKEVTTSAQPAVSDIVAATPELNSERQEALAGSKSSGPIDSELDRLLKKDMFETDEEFQSRLSLLPPVPIGIIELKDDGYDIDNHQFSIQISWGNSFVLDSLPSDTNGAIVDIPREQARSLWVSGKEHPLLASFQRSGRKATISSLYIGWDSNQYLVAAGNICRETSSEVLSTVSGITKEAPVKPIPRIRERPSPKEIQTDVVKSTDTTSGDESFIRFPVWSTFREGPFFPEMVVLPAGSFMMGSNDHESEQPIRRVELKRQFCMGKYPVTCEEYDKFLEANVGQGFDTPGNNQEGRGRCPVSGVSWKDAQAYCEWLSKITKATYRLPSEAEWEYAARAGTTTRYWWGDDVKDGVQYYGPKLPPGKTTSFGTVGSFAPNPWGIYDLLGNVEQWCQDVHDINNEFTPLDGSPRFNSLTHRQIQEMKDRLGDETFYDEKRIRGGRINSLGAFEIKSVSENRQKFDCTSNAYGGFRVVREI
jgi:formylglycine-generating enzyme required for sulfatase activity